MRYSIGTSGLLALGLSSVAVNAAAVPKAEASAAHIVNVDRDWDSLFTHVNDTRGHRGHHQKRASNLDYAGYWFASATAGGKGVSVLLDTGSADLWLVNPSAPSDATNGVQTWDPNGAQGTSIMSGYTFSVSYGQGGNGVSGNVYKTPVCIGSSCTTMAVGSATHDQGMGNGVRSGILGLAFKGGNSIRPTQQPTFMESLVPSLSQPIFVTKFTPQSGSSQISFGSNPFNYVAPLQQITIDTTKYPNSWSFVGVKYEKNGQSLGTFDVVFDTGGPMTSAAESIVRGYYNGIAGARDVNGDASSWTVPCGTKLPDLTMHLGNALLIIPGQNFYNGNTATSGTCTVWFVRENSANRGVIGDPFFTRHVVIFNQNAKTIQWGNQA